jgi:hypothetical protein
MNVPPYGNNHWTGAFMMNIRQQGRSMPKDGLVVKSGIVIVPVMIVGRTSCSLVSRMCQAERGCSLVQASFTQLDVSDQEPGTIRVPSVADLYRLVELFVQRGAITTPMWRVSCAS